MILRSARALKEKMSNEEQNADGGTDGQQPLRPPITSDELSVLLNGITALKETVEELRQETARSQEQVRQLRNRVEADTAASSTAPRAESADAGARANVHVTAAGVAAISNQEISNELQSSSSATNGMLSFNSTPIIATTTSPLNQQLLAMNLKLYPLPAFDGNAEDWPLFFANYRDTTEEFHYNNRQNLMRLHTALQGEARRAVSSMLIFPDDVPKIISELEFNFGRPDILIKSQLDKVQQFPVIYENRLEYVIAFSNRVRNIVAFFKSAKCEHHLINPTLLEQLVIKLPPSKQYEWSRTAASTGSFPTVETFSNWLSDLAKVVTHMPSNLQRTNDQHLSSYPRYPANSQARNAVNTQAPMRARYSAPMQPMQLRNISNSNRQSAPAFYSGRILHNSHNEDQNTNRVCIQCSDKHSLGECQIFNALDLNQKWEQVKRNGLCFACLEKGHNITNCINKTYCGINGCARMHNKILHENIELNRMLNCRQNCESHLFKIFPIILSGPLGSLETYAMLDEGSSVSLLEENISNKLGLRGPMTPLTLQWYDDKEVTEISMKVTLTVSSQNDSRVSFDLKNIRTVKQLNLPKQSFSKENYSHLIELPIKNYTNAKPVLLIGLDNCFLGASEKIVEAGPHMPIAAATKFGWVVYGPFHAEFPTKPGVFHVHETTMKKLDRLVHEYFEIENFGVRSASIVESEENIRARAILKATTRNIGGRYETGLIWKDDNTVFPSSLSMAKSRLFNVEKKMSRDPAFAAQYIKEIEKYINNGYAELLPSNHINSAKSTVWYLPHFGVINPNKPGKLRVVFDAAAAVEKTCLNSALLKGPEHAKPLLTVLHKFRQGTFAVVADVKEMFLQVRIKASDQDSQRFLWRDGDASKPIRVYTMTSMIFGASCSPCSAEYIKNINAIQYQHNMPKGAKLIIENMYVDDLVASFDSKEEADEATREAVLINASAGFELRGFISNNKELQHQLNSQHEVHNEVLNMERQASTDKVLGLFWNAQDDVFEFHFKFFKIPRDVLDGKRAPTKREMLATAMSVFDPFGFLANVMIYIKILLQATWKEQVKWDDTLPQTLAEQWFVWWNEFHHISRFRIHRCYSSLLKTSNEVQLHVFADASSSAYAAVAYFVIKKGSYRDIAFVVAKTRCAPAKGMTIPRLELQAAVLASRLKTYTEESHDIEIKQTIFWTDSKTTIQWIRSTKRQYKQFVKFRVSEILAVSSPEQWRWLPTTLNVADDATRAKPPSTHKFPSRWITGPDFLRHDENDWPREPQDMFSEQCVAEEMPSRLLTAKDVGKFVIDITKYSKFFKIIRVLGWILRFITNAKKLKRDIPQMKELSAGELHTAEKILYRQIQKDSFAKEIEILRSNGCLPKSSHIHQMTPILDEDMLLKVNGRLDAAFCLPAEARRPIILPRDHYVTHLIMRHYHCRAHHQNDNLTINELRQKFWVSSARTLLQTIKKECPTCIIKKAHPCVPLMGQLPIDRVTPFVRPFSYCGVDYCGPFFITVGRRREKRWISLFTCMTTRAIHVEIAEDLSTDAFILCLRNFVNRRGVPIRIRSDNGTNFIGAQRELKKENRLFDFDEISRELSKNNIEWIFNCPSNPSSGGCWERLIQCVKRLLARCLRNEAPRLETFRSAIIEAENIVNSRPLTELPMEPNQDEPLTPNHFLIGSLNSTQTPHPEEEKLCVRKQWRIAQNLKDRLWKRWTVEYLPQLLHRPKWREKVTPLQPGQLVIICDTSQPRSQWQKGKIVKVFPAADGQVRSAELQTAHGLLRRPASKLAALQFVNPGQDSPGGGMSLPDGNSNAKNSNPA